MVDERSEVSVRTLRFSTNVDAQAIAHLRSSSGPFSARDRDGRVKVGRQAEPSRAAELVGFRLFVGVGEIWLPRGRPNLDQLRLDLGKHRQESTQSRPILVKQRCCPGCDNISPNSPHRTRIWSSSPEFGQIRAGVGEILADVDQLRTDFDPGRCVEETWARFDNPRGKLDTGGERISGPGGCVTQHSVPNVYSTNAWLGRRRIALHCSSFRDKSSGQISADPGQTLAMSLL